MIRELREEIQRLQSLVPAKLLVQAGSAGTSIVSPAAGMSEASLWKLHVWQYHKERSRG